MSKRPIRFFNTTGPCIPDDHYMLPPADRLQGAQLHRYVTDNLYWSLHAPRQTGKTTFLQSWMQELNATGKYTACYVSVERCQGMTKIDDAMPNICKAITFYTKQNELPVPTQTEQEAGSMLSDILANWAALVAPQPLVVLFDEIDVLEGDAMISFLRQLRGGFATRGVGKFPTSIALVGMRDLKDYIVSAKDGKPINPGSPFNIKEDSATVSNFSQKNVAALFAQRTKETGQQIESKAIDYVWEQSQGQPWIVNSLFKRATLQILKDNDYQTVTFDHIKQAREQMILARETHLTSLYYRLKDPRVRYVIETLMTGTPDPDLASSEAFQICQDLGLVSFINKTPQVANPIYREVLAREMSYSTQYAIEEPTFQWQKTNGTLDMNSLLKEFQGFWQENSEIWEEKSDYTEAFPHLLLTAFLQRVTNGEGRVEREYAAGSKRMDLAIEYKGSWNIIEIKLLRDRQTFEKVKTEGIKQILTYRNTFSSSLRVKDGEMIPCYLIIFDRRSNNQKLSWEQRISWNVENEVTIVGC
ncbi:MAG: PD-(D/E)XK nuclease domain-containing protein [Planctomycetaceae bacterium]|jgi:hypothetical protein|nr:PD-(D/E)XK nuclease domain-containing protein [Planctomycetaceae bacterium]